MVAPGRDKQLWPVAARRSTQIPCPEMLIYCTQARPLAGLLIESLLTRDARAVARACTLVENGGAEAEALLAALAATGRRALTVGITGPPGAGKSTLTAALVREIRKRGETVAVVAVDPSSHITGGAILGDRIRMVEHHADEGVFIRSMATRGALGGLAPRTREVAAVLGAAGFDAVLIETNGKIAAIMWATGFHPDYSWLDVPVLDDKGHLRHDGGVVASPGMYALGLPFLRRRKSTFISGAEDDARDLVDHLAGYLATPES